MNNFRTVRFLTLGAIVVYSLWLALPVASTQAQTAAPITPSGLNTQVSTPINLPSGKVQYDITGGTRPGAGANLFHSFGDFDVPINNIANFLNETPNLATSNILGRVTGGNISNIFGTIQTTSFGNANLFLLNPAGFLFGPNATVNVGGMVAFTSADYLRLLDSARFNAIPDATADALLTPSPVAAFGFLGSKPGAITVQGSQFTVTQGTGISLVGGNITIESGTLADRTVRAAKLTAPGGQINLANVASSGEISAVNFKPALGITMGAITLSQGTTLDVSANASGTIAIRGGKLVIADATLSANTGNSNGAPVAIDINVTGDLTISDTRAIPAITAASSGSGYAGEVQIVAANVQGTTTDPGFVRFALIDSHSSGNGRAGSVSITTGNLTMTGPEPTWYFIDSGPQGAGHGGDVTISASNHIQLDDTYISTGTQEAELLGLAPSTSAGNLSITADSLQAKDVILDTHATTVLEETQFGGDITLNIRDINMVNTQVGANGMGRGGAIIINADMLITDNTLFQTFNAFAPGRGITFTGRILELTNGSNWSTSTLGDFNAGGILVNATDHVNLAGITGANPLGQFNPSGLFSNSFGGGGTQGGAGNIVVTTPRLTMQEGRINTSTATSGAGGNVTINAGVIKMSGEFPNPDIGGFFGVTNIHPSGIFTQTVGSEFCSGPCGNAGQINVTANTLIMDPGSQINNGTSNTGQGGDIIIHATDQISMSGALSNGDPVGIFSRTIGTASDSGTGGNITLKAGQSVTISDGASVSASSDGPGTAGNIKIIAGQQLEMHDSSLTTQATQASGGNIDIQAVDRVRLVKSSISTSVLGGAGSGGNITIDPTVVVLQNSKVIAQAVQGAGGNITITTPLFLADSGSLVSASSQFGRNGTVAIQSPTSNLSESLGTLPSDPGQAQTLVTQRCAALANGQTSSFIIAGREQIPADPGGWLTSPLAFAEIDADLFTNGTIATIPAIMATHDSGTISLRQLTPAGFLMANFADSEATGCHS